MTTFILRALCVALLGGLLAGAASAHQIWFQQEGGAITFRYGELDVNMHEVSPGGLDRFRQLNATWLRRAGEQPLPLTKQPAGFSVPAVAGPGESFIAVDLHYPMFDTQRDGKALRTWWVPATRWVSDFSARPPKLPLDIVPTGVARGGRVEFMVALRGEALPGVKMTLVVPSGWSRQAVSDADGKFSFALPWRGTYVIGTYYTDEVSGERADEKGAEAYQLEGYNASLSFYKRDGLAPFPVAEKTLPASVLNAAKATKDAVNK